MMPSSSPSASRSPWCGSGCAARRERPTTSAPAAPPLSSRRRGAPASAASSCSPRTASARPARCWASSIASSSRCSSSRRSSTPRSRRASLRGSDLDWTIVQPVHLSDDDSDEHFVSTDGRIRQHKVSRRAVAHVHADLVERHDDDRQDGVRLGLSVARTANDETRDGCRSIRPSSVGGESSGDRDEVDDEDQGLAAEEVAAGGAVGEVRAGSRVRGGRRPSCRGCRPASPG